MNKKEVVRSIFLLILLVIVIIPYGNADTLDDVLGINVTINSPILMIEIVEDYINLGQITRGYVTEAKPFNITNKGTTDATIQPQINSSDEILSNLFFTTTSSGTYKKIGNFTGNITKSSIIGEEKIEDFWIKLDLKDYTGSINGNFIKNLTFWVMSA